jgi:hypothetical protein
MATHNARIDMAMKAIEANPYAVAAMLGVNMAIAEEVLAGLPDNSSAQRTAHIWETIKTRLEEIGQNSKGVAA